MKRKFSSSVYLPKKGRRKNEHLLICANIYKAKEN